MEEIFRDARFLQRASTISSLKFLMHAFQSSWKDRNVELSKLEHLEFFIREFHFTTVTFAVWKLAKFFEPYGLAFP